MELMSVLHVHSSKHTEHISLNHRHGHLQNGDGNQGGTAENGTNATTNGSAGNHLSSKVRYNVHDHVPSRQVCSQTHSKGDCTGEEGNLNKKAVMKCSKSLTFFRFLNVIIL